MSLLNACSEILAHVEQNYAVTGLLVKLAKKEKRVLPSGLLTGNDL